MLGRAVLRDSGISSVLFLIFLITKLLNSSAIPLVCNENTTAYKALYRKGIQIHIFLFLHKTCAVGIH